MNDKEINEIEIINDNYNNNTLTTFDKQLIQYIHDYGYEVVGRDLRGFIYVSNSKGQSEYLNCVSSALKSLRYGSSVFVSMMMQDN